MTRKQQARSDETRDRILLAAIREFSDHGLAGARTDTIAGAAKVNKALLYYYFRNKERLYAEALQKVAGRIAENALAVLDLDCSPGERVLRFALQHFDRMLGQHGFQALMQQEMVRFHAGRGNAGTLQIVTKTAFEPIFARVVGTIHEGIKTGELCRMDPLQVMYAAIGTNVFYFLSAPVMQLVFDADPLTPGAVARRRKTAIEFLGQAIFTDRKHGAHIARSVLASTPMPETAGTNHRAFRGSLPPAPAGRRTS